MRSKNHHLKQLDLLNRLDYFIPSELCEKKLPCQNALDIVMSLLPRIIIVYRSVPNYKSISFRQSHPVLYS